MKFTVHTVVKNEDRWIWYALQSVLPFAEKILVFDTGSTDMTVPIIKSLNSPKITFEEKGPVDRHGLVKLRREQIKRTETEWFLILDGDEIWPEKELKKLLAAAESVEKNIAALFNRNRNCVGDVFHFLPESSGRYSFAGRSGHLNIRMMRKTPSLNIIGEYPLESYTDDHGPIEKQDGNLKFVDCWYLHTSFLKRSSMDESKASGSFKKSKIWEKGISMKNTDLPEVFFRDRLEGVSDPLTKRGFAYDTASMFTTPFISFKRKMNK